MASGCKSNSDTSRNWRERKKLEGYMRIVLWVNPTLGPHLANYAFDEMVPPSVAVEMILKKFFEMEA